MFKQIVTDLIGQHLNRYIEDFDSNSIHFTGFPSSNLRLNHLRIKPDALSSLQLPIVLKHGYVGSLHVVIPFTGLKSTPVQINLENVFIVAGLVKKFDGQEHIKGMRNATDQAILAANGAEEASRVLELHKARREVSELLQQRTRAGKTQYLVSWKGYGPEHNTWESEQNIYERAEQLVLAFKRKAAERTLTITLTLTRTRTRTRTLNLNLNLNLTLSLTLTLTLTVTLTLNP